MSGTGDWIRCVGCRTPIYRKRWERSLFVCPECGHHGALGARQRLSQLADPGTVDHLPVAATSEDVLGFVDTQPYPARLAEARAQTGLDEGVLSARVAIEGQRAIVSVMDFRFMGGSLGSAAGELITLAAEAALDECTPLILVTASGGARMQEGVLSLMQMAKTSAALAMLDEAGILTISLITDPTFGGVAASFATLGDVVLAEPGARLGFAGRRVIEQTIREKLPADFQTAEFLLSRGLIDLVVPRSRLRRELATLLRAGSCGARPAASDLRRRGVAGTVVRDPGRLPKPEAWAQVRAARQLDRPTALDYFTLAFDHFQELRGDRLSGDCRATVAGTAWIDGRPVVVVGQQKGHTPAELIDRNFGMATPAGYRKAGRLMRLADKLGLPVVTLVDTPGAFPGAEAEAQGQALAIAENLRLMSGLGVPVVAVIIGEGGSGGALGLAVANRVLMLSNAVYSVISPEGCAAILWKDPAAGPRAASALGITAQDHLRLGTVDGVIPEPEGGCPADPVLAAVRLRAAVADALAELAPLSAIELRADRRARFRQYGSGLAMETELRTLRQDA